MALAMDQSVKTKFDSYPDDAKRALKNVRTLILHTAKECGAGEVSESLKWNEPSYVTKTGSAIRIDWKAKNPAQYCVYFHCQTTLVETFRELYQDSFVFEGKRAMVFDIGEEIPSKEFQHCISLALRYHEIKHLPMLGV